jgi:hypothetical protein
MTPAVDAAARPLLIRVAAACLGLLFGLLARLTAPRGAGAELMAAHRRVRELQRRWRTAQANPGVSTLTSASAAVDIRRSALHDVRHAFDVAARALEARRSPRARPRLRGPLPPQRRYLSRARRR